MESTLATKQVSARGALIVATRRLLYLIALGYGISYLVPACISLPGEVNDEEPHSSALVPGSGFNLHAELVCGSGQPRVWERSACNLAK